MGKDEELINFVLKNTAPEDDVLFVNCAAYYYLVTNRKTDNEFFYQYPPIVMSEELKDRFWEEIKSIKSDCIIVNTGYMYNMAPHPLFSVDLDEYLIALGYRYEKKENFCVYIKE